MTTLAGKAGTVGTADGTGLAASFTELSGLTTDGTYLYVADQQTVRKISISTGTVTTLAGTAGVYGWADGIGTAALFGRISDITTDGANLYVADSNNTIRKIVIASGAVTTLAGGSTGSTDGVGVSASFGYPSGITTDGASLFITDTFNDTIRAIR
ncbi:NHL repeat-containing protein [Geotalea daltonii]|uniref:NHL repeat containing protein n=1 Tax=Geotalea daltonii TaxID=1203471 RepID=UPI0000DCD120|nr:NHL repeat containing protein [Geotalea daltonii]